MDKKIIDDSEVLDVNNKIEELENQIQTLKEDFTLKIEQEKNNFLLRAAEYDNLKKRLKKESDEIVKYSNEKLVLKFLDILDNLNRAVYYAQDMKNFDTLLKGVQMTLTQFNEALEKENVISIDALNKEFEPNLHDAISQEESDHKDNIVIEEIRKGYIMSGRVIRPTLVKVSKKKGS